MQDGLLQTVLEQEMTCSVCLFIYTEPVTLPCGHNFCSQCIQSVWENTAKNNHYSCPECKTSYFSKPALQKNYKLCNIVDCFSQRLKNCDRSSIPCDICVEGIAAAVKTCLKCELALCAFHLQPHLQRPAFKNHTLIEPIATIQQWRCADHDEILRFFCKDDKAYLCASCTAESLEHRSHNLQNFTTAQNEIKDQLKAKCHELTLKEKEYDWILKECHKAEGQIKEKIAETRLKVKHISAQLRKWIEEYEEDMEKAFQVGEDRVLKDVQNYTSELKSLQMKITFTKEQMRAFIASEEESLQFLKAYESFEHRLPKDTEYPEGFVPHINLDYSSFHEETERAFTIFQEKCSKFKTILHHAFYGNGLTLDQNSANPRLRLTDNFRTVRSAEHCWPYPSHPDRFDYCNQVLCCQAFDQGQHYWEIQTLGDEWAIGLAYQSIPRKDDINECLLGQGADSWCIEWSENQMFACHQSNSTPIVGVENPNKVCVFLDYEAGKITFYSKENTLRHLYSFCTNFSAPLFPGFCVIKGILTLEQ